MPLRRSRVGLLDRWPAEMTRVSLMRTSGMTLRRRAGMSRRYTYYMWWHSWVLLRVRMAVWRYVAERLGWYMSPRWTGAQLMRC